MESQESIYHLLSDPVGEQIYKKKDALLNMLNDASELIKTGHSVTLWKTAKIKTVETTVLDK